jgi:acetyl esterase/lipase
MKKITIFAIVTLSQLAGYTQQVIRLYEGKAPGSETWTWTEKESTRNMFNTRVIYNVADPTLTAFLPAPEIATGTAVIIAPGGAFHTLSIDSEGNEVAKWLNSIGVTAFVLKYRLVESKTDDPVKEMMPLLMNMKKLDELNASVVPLAMQDGLTAVKYVRTHARELNIDPVRIGFMGFSAGGTVTMSVVYNATDENRPNFVAPVYAYASAIVGTEVPEVKTPIFIVAASDDQLVPVQNSVDIYSQWIAVKQPAELHLYEKGNHGFGMNKLNLPVDSWIDRYADWLKMNGYLNISH